MQRALIIGLSLGLVAALAAVAFLAVTLARRIEDEDMRDRRFVANHLRSVQERQRDEMAARVKGELLAQHVIQSGWSDSLLRLRAMADDATATRAEIGRHLDAQIVLMNMGLPSLRKVGGREAISVGCVRRCIAYLEHDSALEPMARTALIAGLRSAIE